MTDPSERPDLVYLARGLAGVVDAGEFERADAWVEAYFDVAAGGYALFQRNDGGCYVLTREGSLCGNPRAEGLHVCHLHDSLIQRREREDA